MRSSYRPPAGFLLGIVCRANSLEAHHRSAFLQGTRGETDWFVTPLSRKECSPLFHPHQSQRGGFLSSPPNVWPDREGRLSRSALKPQDRGGLRGS